MTIVFKKEMGHAHADGFCRRPRHAAAYSMLHQVHFKRVSMNILYDILMGQTIYPTFTNCVSKLQCCSPKTFRYSPRDFTQRNMQFLLKSRDSPILMCVSRRDTRFVILTSVLCPYLVLVVAVVILMGSMQ